MAAYAVNNRLAGTQQAMSTSFKTLLNMRSLTGTLTRGWVYDLEVGADGAPNATDTPLVFDVARSTVDGTGEGAVTPNQLDLADAASRATVGANYTVEPTITAASTLLALPLNQRATQRWAAHPGSELIWPATNEAGLAVRALAVTAYVGTSMASVLFRE